MRGSELGCGDHQQARARSICEAVSQDMEFGWRSRDGAVGYGVTPRTVKKVFCRLRIRSDDVAALRTLDSPREEQRVREAAAALLELLRVPPYTARAGVYDSDNPRYVLKRGCAHSL